MPVSCGHSQSLRDITGLFESVDPVAFQIVQQENHTADTPGKWIGPEQKPDLMADVHGDRNICNSQDAPDGKHNYHWNCGLPCAAADTCHAVIKAQQKEKT